MKKTINNYEFNTEFTNMGRENNFTGNGLDTLFEMLEEYEEETGEEMELDVIAICCQFSEYTIEELINDYEWAREYDTDEEDEDATRENIEMALESVGAYYRWIDDESLILDVESF